MLCRGRSSIGEPRRNAGGNPRRNCDSSQQADRVGSECTYGSTFVQRARSCCFNNWAEGYVIVRIFFRETGKLVHISSWMKHHPHVRKLQKTGIIQYYMKSACQGSSLYSIYPVFSMASRVGSSKLTSITRSRINRNSCRIGNNLHAEKGLINTCQK